ncbi:tetratricopeptide repeat protein [Massilia sp. Dwa41.01b]|uniref:tetratricopeptide repeat protein n=1 Tax=unclassified Massilia TaxID=2609279 RepID=UPI001603BFB3|nr:MULTISPECIES: tetratricopeptide repeat protein [unclassified Massilia]QNA88342.1 tetratricopeptide repeat protein [Massilia sp. Dwa41.01b]QNA99242.1 tetratricopeptide repeat protein [Massilia sp. Se16.2.3]
MSHFRLARLCLLLAAVGLNSAPALMTSAHAQKNDAPAAAAKNSVRPELAKLLDPAQLQPLISAKNTAELNARLGQADALPNKTPYETYVITRMKMVSASIANDTAAFATTSEQVIQSGFEPKEMQPKLVLTLADMQFKAANYAGAIQSLKRYESMGADMTTARLMLSRAYYLNKDYAAAKPLLLQVIEETEKAGKTPTMEDLKLLRSAASETKDNAAREIVAQKLVTYYPADEWWDELIRLGVTSKPGFDQNNPLPLRRLQFAAIKTLDESEYMDLAELALRDTFATEAKNVLDAGYAAGVLGKGANAKAHDALRSRANKGAADDAKNIASGEASASKAKTGAGLVNLGWAYTTMGQADKGIGLIQQGIAKGGLKQPDEAKLRLGQAQAKAGHKEDAIKTFESVKARGGLSDIARMHILLLRQPAAGAAPAAAPAAATASTQ